jgi:hypothetical protein
MKAIINGTTYEAKSLPIGPNMAKHTEGAWGLTGPRGATFYLAKPRGGRWFMLAMGGWQCQKTYPRNVQIQEAA